MRTVTGVSRKPRTMTLRTCINTGMYSYVQSIGIFNTCGLMVSSLAAATRKSACTTVKYIISTRVVKALRGSRPRRIETHNHEGDGHPIATFGEIARGLDSRESYGVISPSGNK